jgi:Fe-Mn family superoxide dismutase
MSNHTVTLPEYTVKSFPHLDHLKYIPNAEFIEHLKLYKGYVTALNILRIKTRELADEGKAGTPEFSELVRRLGFEYNGMRLHELYFENLTGLADMPGEAFMKAIKESFGTWEEWVDEFKKMAAMRGVGWVILYKDPATGFLSTHWIGMHEEGHPVGFTPILVCDCWEHAWTGYLKPTERAKYVEDFFVSIDWRVVEKRLGM